MLGSVAILNSFFTLVTIFTVLGTNTAILRLIPENMMKYSPATAFSVYRKTQYFVGGLSLLSSIGLFFFSGIIADVLFSKPHLQFYFAISSAFIIFKSIVDLNQQAVRGLKLIRTFAFMQLFPQLSKLLILIIMTFVFFQKDSPVYALLFSFFITAVAGIWFMDRAFKKRISSSDILHLIPMNEIISISFPMLLTATMTFLIGQTGVLVLGIYRPESEVGYYSIAVKLSTLTAFILSAVNSMTAPKFSELFYSNQIDELFYVAKKSTKLIFWTTMPILFFLILGGRVLISLIFGDDFSVAYLPMCLMIIGQFVNSFSGSCGYFLNMTGNQKTLSTIMMASAILNLCINLALTPKYGMIGAAIAAMFSFVFINCCALFCIKKKYGRSTSYFPLIIK